MALFDFTILWHNLKIAGLARKSCIKLYSFEGSLCCRKELGRKEMGYAETGRLGEGCPFPLIFTALRIYAVHRVGNFLFMRLPSASAFRSSLQFAKFP
jgi:hypothetical protein